MKNKKLLLLLLPFLVACNGGSTPSSSEVESYAPSSDPISEVVSEAESSSEPAHTFDLANALNSFASGIKVDVVADENYNGTSYTYYMRNASKSKEFSSILYKDASREAKASHEYYVALKGYDFLLATRLNMSNDYNYYKVYNSATSEYYTWNDGFDNAFASFSASDFSSGEDGSYSLSTEKCSEFSAYLSTILYGQPGLEFTNFTISSANDEIRFSAAAGFTGVNYTCTFDATVVEHGADTTMDYRAVPYEDVEDAAFDKMIADLKGNNYTATIHTDDGFDEATYSYLSEEDKIYYEAGSNKYGFYTVEEGLVQQVKKDGEAFYKVGNPLEGSVAEVQPTFDVSRAVFDYADGVYTLKSGVEGDIFEFIVLETYTEEIDELTIAITEGGYVVTNVYDDCTTTITYTNIGTTDCGFDADTVLEPVAGTTWADIFDAETYQLLVDIAGEELAAYIPVPEGYSEWYQLSEEEGYVFFAAAASETIDDDIYSYYLQLSEAGFIFYTEEGFNGGIMMLYPMDDEGTSYLAVEFLEYEGMFAVLVYIAEE